MQLVVVDCGSKDGTVALARSAGATVVELPQESFSYPLASNLGAAATTTEIIVMLSAHAFPIGKGWLASLAPHFANPGVVGVYGPVLPHGSHTLAEWLAEVPSYWWLRLRGGRRRIRRSAPGVLGATNCAIRAAVWKERNFDERWGAGGEDHEWASWALGQGYEIWIEAQFAVRHSHHLSFIGYLRQWRHWMSLTGPRPFDRKELDFRSDLAD